MGARNVVGAMATFALVVGASVVPAVKADEVSPVRGSSAITGMWAWGNAVPASVDYRGLGESDFAPAAIAGFAAARRLDSVRLSVPWAADEGPEITASIAQSVIALHESGVVVAALGGDPGWVAEPSLAGQWITAAKSAGDFDSVELDVEPWTEPGWSTDPVAIAEFIALVETAEAVAHSLGMRLGVDLPWWLAHKRYGASTIFDALLAHIDSVSIVTFVDHAAGDDGIVALSSLAVSQARAEGKPFTIGVETDTPAVAGGARYTFSDGGSRVLESAAATVRLVYGSTTGYQGVTVEHYLSWLALKP